MAAAIVPSVDQSSNAATSAMIDWEGQGRVAGAAWCCVMVSLPGKIWLALTYVSDLMANYNIPPKLCCQTPRYQSS